MSDTVGPGARGEHERVIVEVLVSIGPGEVVSYGDVARAAGWPRHHRLVARVLQTTCIEVPWWRVVTAGGRLVPGLEADQRRLLATEGVVVRAGRVVDAPAGRFARRSGRGAPGSVDRQSPGAD